MRIGTTPTHTFTFTSDLASAIKKVRIVYAQDGEVVLCRDVEQLTGNDVVLTLTQEETLKFACRKPIDIQVRVLTTDGKSFTSNIFSRNPYECLQRSVLE